MLNKTKKRIRIVWIIISLFGIIGMIAFTLIPLLQSI